MNYGIFLYTVFFMLSSCGNIKQSSNATANEINNAITSENLNVEIKKNTVYSLIKDTTGALYPAFETGNATTLIFKYTEKGPKGIVDGDYTETIHLMIPDNIERGDYSDADLQKVTMLFGKFCFCRGESGYYPVTKGKLSVKNKEGAMTINVSYEIPKTSAKVTAIKQTVLL
jgi:hypothetical protein